LWWFALLRSHRASGTLSPATALRSVPQGILGRFITGIVTSDHHRRRHTITMLNPTLPPFVPRPASLPPRPSVLKKQLRLLRFPLCMRFHKLNNAQCAQLRIRRKPLVHRSKQLRNCRRFLEKSKEMLQQSLDETDRSLINFIGIARHIHSLSIDQIGPPPFDGWTYAWTWKGIRMSFIGSSHRFQLAFHFNRYVCSLNRPVVVYT